ncbi:MAG: hypothetical protein IJV27_01470 [Prevotella sp.]|nr:hypothetical protein [Prevotella sp.]
MQRTKKILTRELLFSLSLTFLIILLFETGLLMSGVFIDDESIKFVVTVAMELLTIGLIPTALYLFKIRRIHNSLTEERQAAESLLFWGSIRMMMLCVPLFLNVLSYYLFGFDFRFGYMAIILFLCLFMIFPSMNRCVAETTKR